MFKFEFIGSFLIVDCSWIQNQIHQATMITKLFATQIYHSALQSTERKSGGLKQKRELQSLASEILKIQQVDLQGQKWSEKHYDFGYTSYGSMDQLHQFSSSFKDLDLRIRTHLKRYVRALEWDVNIKHLKLSSMWANIMPQGAHHSFHLHPHSVISGTYYIQIPPGSSSLQFEDPRLSRRMASPPLLEKRLKNHYSLQPQAGDLVLFESWLRHQVPTQKSLKPRISVSFNYDWVR